MVDPSAAKVILEAFNATAMCGYLHLLGPVPLTKQEVVNLSKIWQQLYNAPIAQVSQLAPTGMMGPRAELCLSWALTSYRGALISIPSELVDASIRTSTMLFMANANREKEREFADKLVPSGGGDSLIVSMAPHLIGSIRFFITV